MLKNLLVLTVSTSFVAILLMANSPILLNLSAHSLTQKPSVLTLSIISPSLQPAAEHIGSNHLGCSCALCVSGREANLTVG